MRTDILPAVGSEIQILPLTSIDCFSILRLCELKYVQNRLSAGTFLSTYGSFLNSRFENYVRIFEFCYTSFFQRCSDHMLLVLKPPQSAVITPVRSVKTNNIIPAFYLHTPSCKLFFTVFENEHRKFEPPQSTAVMKTT